MLTLALQIANGFVGLRGTLCVGVVAQSTLVKGIADAFGRGGIVRVQMADNVFSIAHDEDLLV
ncbi:MAG: hypothetical protein INR71_16130, partial [Terriglobus roseus]|nr:hypothetical protein [Terriglobus roseus]